MCDSCKNNKTFLNQVHQAQKKARLRKQTSKLFKPAGVLKLDTLAQLGTKRLKARKNRRFTIAESETNFTEIDSFPTLEKGTDFKDKKTLKKRARRKYIAENLALGLINYSKAHCKSLCEKAKKLGKSRTTIWRIKNKYSKIQKSYWNLYDCCNIAEKQNGQFVSRYCKNRLCMVCNSIRTAELTTKYQPVLDAWQGKMWFVTLTAPTVDGNRLKEEIEERQAIFKKIQERFKKRAQRSKGNMPKFKGIRKLECTYNKHANKYHPHYHVIVYGEMLAHDLLESWLWETRHLGSSRAGQDIRPADENTASELFKYFTKVISGKRDKDDKREIHLEAMDTIFNAVKCKRTFQTFGFKLSDYQEETKEQRELPPPPVETSPEAIADLNEFLAPEIYEWNRKANDWVSISTGECASGYILSENVVEWCNSMVMPIRLRRRQKKRK